MSTKAKLALAESLGYNYINEFFCGAMFTKGDSIYQIRICNSEDIECHTVDKNAEIGKASWKSARLPLDALSSFSDIKWPKLGYRNLPNGLYGNQVSFITSTRSVQRGLKFDHLAFENLAVGDTLGGTSNRTIDITLRIFFPVWYSFKEGMQKIRDLEFPAFAINEDVAVGLSIDQGPDRFVDIYYRGKVVGAVLEDDSILIANKTIKRGNLKQLINLLEK